MRLTCPNCDAQYEVPDEVVPIEGRDVQCSNCGNTWFHFHPDRPAPEAEPDPVAPAPEPDAVADDTEEPQQVDAVAEPSGDDQPAKEETARAPREIDPAVADILRQEADRETKLRASENPAGLESQPDLGLDSLSEDTSAHQPAEPRKPGKPTTGQPTDDGGTRRGLLPDIEEINSTLRASGDGTEIDLRHDDDIPEQGRKSGGFTRGLGVVLILVIVLVLLYSNAASISEAVPQAAPVMDSYVATVNQGRVWLDATISSYTPK